MFSIYVLIMVKVCSITSYPEDSFSKYKEYFEKFSYELHIFQKWALEGIVLGNHVLVTAPTGSGKSLPAEFALDYFHAKGKKTIYCSPIKALSNQKYYDFTNKYPHITFGLITGDIKTNPDADVLIMTTEILLNKLYQVQSKTDNVVSSVSFDMDIENDLGAVVFDEIRMINDKDRGHVWENSIMMLPRHIQMIGLSATLDDPSKFAYWLENRGEQPSDNTEKIVYLVKKTVRAVPLTHYSYITTNNSIFKLVKDKAVQSEVKNITNKLFVIQDAKGKFDNDHYDKVAKTLDLFGKNKVRVKRNHVLNNVSKLLVEKNMLPALCYVFSRRQIDICAKELTVPLLEFDSKIPYTVKRECDDIIRKLPNYEEYLLLPEYNTLVSLLEKGIATHHSGMMPVLREIVELFFAKGYIKMLFCTETVAIGLNLPVKTTIFTDINKHDGDQFRCLLGHEFVQASGRAGRLGLDTVGNVIHLNNLFRDTSKWEYKQMLSGAPQSLISKFKISYNLLLNLIDIGDSNVKSFARKSMITNDIDEQLKGIYNKITTTQKELDETNNKGTKHYDEKMAKVYQDYLDTCQQIEKVAPKKRAKLYSHIDNLKAEYPNIEANSRIFNKSTDNRNKLTLQLQIYEKEYKEASNYMDYSIENVVQLLAEEGYVEIDNNNTTDTYTLTPRGKIASNIKEIHSLAFGKLIEQKKLQRLTSHELVALFSCFTNLTINDDMKSYQPNIDAPNLTNLLFDVKQLYDEFQKKETQQGINSGLDYDIHFDLVSYVVDWCSCNNPAECRQILDRLAGDKGIFLGEFVKALLKINNISAEMEKVAELTGDMEFLSKLRDIPQLTLKYVVTNQSLYV